MCTARTDPTCRRSVAGVTATAAVEDAYVFGVIDPARTVCLDVTDSVKT